jgi:hypothetical protein
MRNEWNSRHDVYIAPIWDLHRQGCTEDVPGWKTRRHKGDELGGRREPVLELDSSKETFVSCYIQAACSKTST